MIKNKREAEDGVDEGPNQYISQEDYNVGVRYAKQWGDEERESAESLVETKQPMSPCIYKIENKSRLDPITPNEWKTNQSIRLALKVNKVPSGGEIHLLSSFRPDFWLN